MQGALRVPDSGKPHSTKVGQSSGRQDVSILMADDDRNEQLLTVLAAEEANVNAEFTFVDDGAQLLIYLNQRVATGALPGLILLDLRMPILDGHRTIRQLQAHPVLWQIPVIAFSSSTREEDRQRSIDAGAQWFETKPSDYGEMVKFIESLPDRAFAGTYDLGDLEIDLSGSLDSNLDDLDNLDIDLTQMDL